MIGIKEIAQAANVSVTTVRRALNDLSDINLRTKQKVLKTAKQLNYQKNLLASSLVKNKTHIIGVIIPDIEISFYPSLILGIERANNSADYRLLLYHSDYTLEGFLKGIDAFAGYRVDGMIIVPVPSREKNKIVSYLKKMKRPYVFVDEYFDDVNISFVSTDDRPGAIKAIEYLVGLGHRRIAHFSGNLEDITAQKRLSGYKTGLKKAGISCDKNLVIESGVTRQAGREAARKILAMDKLPTAVFCYNDMVATGAMKMFLDNGLRIPEDISIIGYAGLPDTDMLKVPLSTVYQPAREMGARAAQLLIDEIERRPKKKQKVLLKTELIIRESCRRYDIGRDLNDE